MAKSPSTPLPVRVSVTWRPGYRPMVAETSRSYARVLAVKTNALGSKPDSIAKVFGAPDAFVQARPPTTASFATPQRVYVANAFTLPVIERSQLPALTSTARAGAATAIPRAAAAGRSHFTPFFIVSSLFLSPGNWAGLYHALPNRKLDFIVDALTPSKFRPPLRRS